MMHSLQKWARHDPFSIAFGIAVGLGLALWFQPPHLTYENLPFPPHLKAIKAGEVMPLTVRRCNNSDSLQAYLVTHKLESLSNPEMVAIVMPAMPTGIKPGCETVTSLINLVPAATPPGRYRIIGAGIIQGALRSYVVPWHSEPFDVVGGP